MTRLFLLAAILALSACADSEEASLVPIDEDEGYNRIDPVEAAVPQDRQLSLGDWSLASQEDQSVLQFGPAGTAPLLSLRCDDREGLLIQRPGVVPTGEAEMMTVSVRGSAHRLAVNPVAGAVPVLRAAVPASNDLIGELRDASTPITVAVGDGPALNLPSSPLIGDYIRSCAESPPTADAAPDEGNAAEASE